MIDLIAEAASIQKFIEAVDAYEEISARLEKLASLKSQFYQR